MLITGSDIGGLLVILALYSALFYYWIFPKHPSKFIRYQLIGLAIYHIGFSFFYHQYLTLNGGDALRYWEVSADLSQYAQSWMGYFGFSTFFIQWLNYIPSKMLGLSFLVGNLSYGFCSFIGLVFGIFLTRSLFGELEKKGWLQILPFLIWWFPGLQFWIAGVSKETLLFVGLMGMWYFSNAENNKVYLALFSWLLVFLIKPLIGFLLVFFLLILFWNKSGRKRRLGMGMLILLLPVVYGGLRWLWVYSHLEVVSFAELLRFSQEQLNFLKGFHANTELAMSEYSWIVRYLSVLFRPLIWEVWDLFSLIFALENLLLLFLHMGAVFFGFRRLLHLPWALSYFLVLTLGMFFLYSMTLNNYGLFYRMKSVWLPFLYIGLLWLIWPFIIRKTR